jgi:MraZ protein
VAGLLGTHRYQLDPKGRISLPKGFRGSFSDGAYLTLGHDGCVFAFPFTEWERRSQEVQSRPLSDPEGRAYARLFFGSAESVELDVQGRLLVPQRLRARAEIGREAVVVGVQDRMEIWDAKTWERYESVHDGAYQAGTLGDR